MRSKLTLFMIVCIVGCLGLQASTAPVLYNTGVNDSGVRITGTDTHYQVTYPGIDLNNNSPIGSIGPFAAYSNPDTVWPIVDGIWMNPGTTASWITPTALAGDYTTHPGGQYKFTTSFTYTGTQTAGTYLHLEGSWATDNIGGLCTAANGICSDSPTGYTSGIQLQGASTLVYGGANAVIPPGGQVGFQNAYKFSWLIPTSSLIVGTNLLNFYVYNIPQASGNPAGLLITGMSASIVPEPMAGLLFGTVGVALLLSRRLRRRA